MGVSVRDAVIADAEALTALIRELGYSATPAETAARFQGLLAEGKPPLIAQVGGVVVGMLTWNVMPVLHRRGPVGRISALIVTEGARGQGIGRALVAAAAERLGAQGCILLEVTSNVRLEQAHAFYERLGFERTSWRFAKPLG